MGLKTEFDVDAVVATIEGVGRDSTEAAYQALVEGGKEIRDLARQYAPIDDGNLEEAIQLEKVPSEHMVNIGIDPTATDEAGRSVAGYGMLMHEFQTIGGGSLPAGMGIYGLGKKSQAKDGGRNVVGGKFLERAYNQLVKKIMRNTAIKVKRVYSRVSGGESEE